MGKLKEVAQFCIEVEDFPGELGRFMRVMRDAKVNLKGLWGFGTGGGKAQIFVIPQNTEKFKKVAQKNGYSHIPGIAFFFSGMDKSGALCGILDKIAEAGVNLHAADAISVGGKFGAYLWVDQGDLKKLKKPIQ